MIITSRICQCHKTFSRQKWIRSVFHKNKICRVQRDGDDLIQISIIIEVDQRDGSF